MGVWSTGPGPVVLLAFLTGVGAFSKNFVNSSHPDSKYTFVVNFDFSQIICQHSENSSDLHVHEMSILCDGKQDCFSNPAMHDESFPYCEKKCDSTCNNRGACLYDGHQAQCYCNSGFSGPSCEFIDKNECLDRPCHLMADCLNTPLGFSCVCRPGFHGDGYNCADIDECSVSNLCPEHSTCVNLPGTHYCNCTKGFVQKGESLLTKCVDIDECAKGTHQCEKNQLCENTIGGYTCVSGCTNGYELIDGECVDIDECKKENLCDLRAECFNSPGSYSCVCEDGMVGDGKKCEPITDCTQRDDICDRHAQCIHPFRMCQCVAGFVGDGITCHDIDECEASVEPCKNQKGTHCVNIVGGHICCEEGSDDARCIEEKGVFCAGGCGMNAFCGNKTCECLAGYSGDPLKKCLDVNECDADNMCPGVGQWCVNVFGSYLCCGPNSKEPECQGVHIFRNSDGTTALLHTNHSKEVVISGEQGEHGITQQGGFIAIGRGVIRANGSLPSISVLSKRPCTTYCPINSECINGFCECTKGYGGNAHLGCEDINECLNLPCGEETNENWCVNTIGSYTCCTPSSSQDECIGLEISIGAGGARMNTFGGTGGNNKEDFTVAASINESSTVEVLSERIDQARNTSEGGAILIVKQKKIPTDVNILKPTSGEMGLEIIGSDIEKGMTKETAPSSTTVLPGIISTIGGLSSSTTSVPITEIPIHIPGEHTTTKINGTTVLLISSTLKPKLDSEAPESTTHSLEDRDMLQGGQTTTKALPTLEGHINVHFTTLENSINLNETRTSPRLSEGTTEKPKTIVDGDGTEDVNIVDQLIRTTKEPTDEKKNEPNPEKEGLEIVALATKPPTDVATKTTEELEATTPSSRTSEKPTRVVEGGVNTTLVAGTIGLVATTSSSPSKTDTEEGSGDGGNDNPDLIEEEKKKDSSTADSKMSTINIVVSGHDDKGKGSSVSIKSGGEQKAPKTDIHGGNSLEGSIEKHTTTEATTGETGLEIVFHGTNSTPLPGSSVPTKEISSEGTKVEHNEVDSSGFSSSGSNGTIVIGKHGPNTIGKETDLGEATTPSTSQSEEISTVGPIKTELTTEETGLEIVFRGSSTPDLGQHTSTQSSSATIVASSSSTTEVPSSTKKIDSGKITAGTSSEGTTPSPAQTKGKEEETTATTRDGRISISIGSTEASTGITETTTESSTAETGLEIVHIVTTPAGQTTTTAGSTTTDQEATKKVTVLPTTVNGKETEEGKISTTGTTLSTSTEEVTGETGLEIVAETTPTTAGSSIITATSEYTTKQPDLILTGAPTEANKSSTNGSLTTSSQFSTTTESTAPPSTTEAGLEIVHETTKSTHEVTEEQPDLVLTTEKKMEETVVTTLSTSMGTPKTSSITIVASSEGTTTPVSIETTTLTIAKEKTTASQTSISPSSTASTTNQPDLVLTGATEKQEKIKSTSKTAEEATIVPATASSLPPSSSTTTIESTTSQPELNVTPAPKAQLTSTTAIGTSKTSSITTVTSTEGQTTPASIETTTPIITKEKTTASQTSISPSSTVSTTKEEKISVETTVTQTSSTPPSTAAISSAKTSGSSEISKTSTVSFTTSVFPVTAAGKIDKTTKIPETDVEIATPEPDSDLTGSPTKQNRLPPTDVPAEPVEATTAEPTKETFALPEESTPSPATLGPNNLTKCVSSDECGGDALCERRTGACRCLPGFQGTPPTTPCTDVDECAEGLHKCHETARCHNIVGTYACFCPMGFRKNELGVCVDIDECVESRGNCCSKNGTCVNKEGSYGCECKPGFFGDGYKCMPIEKRTCTESELAKANCGQHHICAIDGEGIFDCNTCKMGFRMFDGKCTDINECVEPGLNMCSPTANCNNLLGTYACSCKDGFKGDGYMCEDIDECSNNPCHPQAECENLLGSFKCTCPSGFTGDGIKDCKNPMERSCENVKEFCGRIDHTACLSVRIFNGSLSSVCECEPGFRYNKQLNNCEDINECDENRHNCDPASSVCINEDGGYHCDCAEGYEGIGGICVDVNECERGTAGCHSMAMCLNQPGSCGCKCMEGFTGDGIQCNSMKREEENACTAEWDRLCLLENKTCHVDEEDVPQCGSCIEGHHPINGSCQPVHGAGTCADPNKNICDKNAECIDIPGTPGKHFCTCKKGFIGDGLRCDGPNCHLNGELCHANAECTMDGLCMCKKGFEGDGFKECIEVTRTSTAATETATAAPPSMIPPNFETTEVAPTTEQEMYGSTPESTVTTTTAIATTAVTTEDDVEVRTETSEPQLPQREGHKKCSADDRSRCHEFAICDLSTLSCRCKDGFEGDGYFNCRHVVSIDCVSNSSLCHSDAFCDRHTRKCSCSVGYIGDGIICSPDPSDCVLRKDLCSPDAVCSGRRCRCVEGFTGDGIKCVSLHQRSANCSECDVNAHCDQGVCSCNTGYFGNGLCCVPDPRDCVQFPGVCHPEASCSRETRQCTCNKGYLGDGISCFAVVSCITDPSVCHKNAICLPSGHCMCQNGFEGNGHTCRPASPFANHLVAHDTPSLCANRCNKESELCIEGECICKHGYKKKNNVCEDIDECLSAPCHSLASCHNIRGSFSCSCPEGFIGDGKTCIQHLKIGELGVFCENDGMTLVLSNETQMFEGKMYVRGQADNPNCIKTFSPFQQHSRPYTFKVFFEHCNVQLLENNTFATTVIVQKHPHFITTAADSYDLKCSYKPGVTQVQSHVNVSELAPTSTLSNQFDGPKCSLKITDDHNDSVESAKVGQSMVLRLEVGPNGTYGILPRDCVAVNIETGERYQLTDKYGCAVDDQLFPEFIQVHTSATQAVFRTFKWPDSSMIRFQCDCKACVGPCPQPDCQRKILPRFRRAHKGEIEEIDKELERLNEKTVETNRKVFSRLLTVDEDVREEMAQEEIDHWNRGRSVLSESLPNISRPDAEGVCVRTAVLAGASLLLLLSLAFLTSTALHRRRSIPAKSPDSPISVISF